MTKIYTITVALPHVAKDDVIVEMTADIIITIIMSIALMLLSF